MSDSKHRGRLWVIEGGDGTGKSTQLALLRARLEFAGYRCFVTRQPTDWYRQQPLTRRFLDAGGTLAEARVLSLMAAADRLAHCADVIGPALRENDFVLCDRYVYSSLVYFSLRGISMKFVASINEGILKPDGAVFLDVPAELVDARLSHRDGERKKFEERSIGTIERIRTGFLSLSHLLRIVDATGEADDVSRSVYRELSAGLPKISTSQQC